MTTFCLIHGSWHGAWCWERLIPKLEVGAHRAIAVELPSDRPGTTCSDYADLIAEALAATDDDVVLVGHSFGGLTIPLVAARRPLRKLVFLAALIPEPGSSMTEQFEAGENAIVFNRGRELSEDQSLSYWVDREAAIAAMYHDCSPENADWAWSRLRPQSRAAQNEVCPLQRLPDVDAEYIVCADDRMASTEWARSRARQRLGVEPREIPGGHSPFVSRPDELAEVLISVG
jgi:pimeloyl-ACP methyl ester carboxylesterase